MDAAVSGQAVGARPLRTLRPPRALCARAACLLRRRAWGSGGPHRPPPSPLDAGLLGPRRGHGSQGARGSFCSGDPQRPLISTVPRRHGGAALRFAPPLSLHQAGPAPQGPSPHLVRRRLILGALVGAPRLAGRRRWHSSKQARPRLGHQWQRPRPDQAFCSSALRTLRTCGPDRSRSWALPCVQQEAEQHPRSLSTGCLCRPHPWGPKRPPGTSADAAGCLASTGWTRLRAAAFSPDVFTLWPPKLARSWRVSVKVRAAQKLLQRKLPGARAAPGAVGPVLTPRWRPCRRGRAAGSPRSSSRVFRCCPMDGRRFCNTKTLWGHFKKVFSDEQYSFLK